MIACQLIGGRFRIDDLEHDLVGRGGMGTVYRATDTHTGDLVAIKALDPYAVAPDPKLPERFTREGEALRQLDHPNIVRMVASVEEEGRHYLVMEYVPGGSLRQVLERQGRLSAERTVEVALDLADALTRAHRLGILHRDLKPENVLLAADGTPRLADFGLAHLPTGSRLTQSGMLMGTVDYVSPEACEGEAPDERSDIWSFGVMLFEMLTGRIPFGGDTLIGRLNAILTQPVPDLAQLAPHLPDGLVDLVYRMLEKDPCQRIPSVRLVGAELEALLKGWGAIAPAHVPPSVSRFATPTPTADASKHNLPLQTTLFVGREAELVELARLLSDPAVRLLSVVGLGGMGKTRLVIEAGARQLERFAHGVWFVSLAEIEAAEAMVPTTAQALGFTFYEGREPRQQLLDYLREKQMLLIYDNFEHLLDGVSLVNDILHSARGVLVLSTSRVRLGVPEEHLFHLAGMEFPDWETPADALEYSAVKLFLQGARRARPGFELAAEDLRYVARICRLVGGMPLGILLAAAWLEMLTPAEIAAEMQRSLDFLATDLSGVDARQRSVRAVLDYSWNSLTEQERSVFRGLSVFRGGFTREAAQAVTGASLRELMGLVNKSLLSRTPAGRYDIHELLRQYAAEKLAEAPDEERAAHDRHCAYHAEFLRQRASELLGREQRVALAEIGADIENVSTAWVWALAHGRTEDLERILEPLADFCRLHGWYREGETLFSRAEQMLAQSVETGSRLLLGKVLLQQGRFATFLGNEPEADRLLKAGLLLFRELGAKREEAHALCLLGGAESLYGGPGRELCLDGLDLFRQVGDGRGVAMALQGLAWCAWHAGEYTDAKQRFEESLALFRQISDPEGMTRCLHGLGHTCWILGEYEQAEQTHTEMLHLCQDTGNRGGIARALGDLGIDAYGLRRYDRARALMEQSLALYRDMGNASGMKDELADLGEAANLLGDYAAAERYAREALSFVELGSLDYDGGAFECRVLGNAACGLGNLAEARASLCRSLQAVFAVRTPHRYLWPLLGVARLLARQQKKERALELLALVMSHRYSWQVTKDQAALLVTELEAELPPEVVAAALERGRARDLDATVAELLVELGEQRE
jgi:serine/threonine protein kinase/tetratricopeptide (TPR) repeat protein